ncbi:MAG TPA: peptidase M23, partial [Hyphomicrobium zavarzinii]|nr:peptidase M23 [Hyphomicrobium zavarzinii]
MSRTRIATSSEKQRARRIAAALTLAMAASGAVMSAAPAQTPQSTDDATRKLENQKSELAAKEARDRELQKDLVSIADERREINARLVETAALVQKSEEQMTAIENRLAGFEKQEQAVRASLAKEHSKISGILAALQRMGRNPPPVIITQREDALEMVRSAMLLGIAFPGLREEARVLTTKLNELVGIMNNIRREGDNLRAERDRLNATQTRLASLLETKKQSLADRQAELKQVREATAEISKNFSDLSELIARLSQQVNTTPTLSPPEKPEDQQVVAMLPPATPPKAPAGSEAVPAARTIAPDTAVDSAPPVPPQRAEEVAMMTPPP